MPDFTHDWFSHNIPTWEKFVAKEYAGKEHIQFLEIGCFEGKASLWLMENVLTAPTAKLHVCDTFKGSDEHADAGMDFSPVKERFYKNLQPHLDKMQIYEMPSKQLAPHIGLLDFDLIYIDGSHDSRDVIRDALLAHDHIKQGGLIIFDDYEWKAYTDPWRNPRPAVDAFLSIFLAEYSVLHKGYQVILKKL